jgi:long-chain acyl-CoA synthetase
VKVWAAANNVEVGDMKDLILREDFNKAVLTDLLRQATESKFNSLEKVKQIYLTMDPFTIESDLLTPTMKIKRNVAKTYFV